MKPVLGALRAPFTRRRDQYQALERSYQESQQAVARQQKEIDQLMHRSAIWKQLVALVVNGETIDIKMPALLDLARQLVGSEGAIVQLLPSGEEQLSYYSSSEDGCDWEAAIEGLSEVTETPGALTQPVVTAPAFWTVPLQTEHQVVGHLYLMEGSSPEDRHRPEDESEMTLFATHLAQIVASAREEASQKEPPPRPVVRMLDVNQPSLADLLLHKELSEEQALRYIRQAARCLVPRHHEKLSLTLHPSSVVVDREENKAYILPPPIGPDPDLDTYTEGFVAPEVRSQGATVKTDVYALGAYLYMLYYGRLPPNRTHLRTVLDHLNLDTSYIGIDYLLRKALWPVPDHRLADAVGFISLLDAILARGRQAGSMNGDARLDIGAQLDVGVRKGRYRGLNGRDLEDRLFWDMDAQERVYLMAIADGVSRANVGTGYDAAMILTDECARLWNRVVHQGVKGPAHPKDALRQILDNANQAIFNQVSVSLSEWDRETPPEPMAAAVCLVLGDTDEAIIANLGDVHAYLVTPHFVARLTKDHTRIADALQTPGPIAYDLLDNLSGSALSRNLGTWQRSSDAQIEPGALDPSIVVQSLFPGDTLVIASDGVHGYACEPDGLFEDSLGQVLKTTKDAQLVAFRLMTLANYNGGQDNISCIVCRIMHPGAP